MFPQPSHFIFGAGDGDRTRSYTDSKPVAYASSATPAQRFHGPRGFFAGHGLVELLTRSHEKAPRLTVVVLRIEIALGSVVPEAGTKHPRPTFGSRKGYGDSCHTTSP